MSSPNSPEIVKRLQQIWEQYQVANTAVRAAQDGLRASEAQLLCDTASYLSPFANWDKADDSQAQIKVARRLVRVLVRFAETSLLEGEGTLSIDPEPLELLFTEPADDRSARDVLRPDFTMAAIWAQLEAQYGGGAAERVAREQAAEAFVNAFHLATRPQMKRQKNGVVLSLHVHTRDAIGTQGGRMLDFSYDHILVRACHSLCGCLTLLDGDWRAEQAALAQFVRFVEEIASRFSGFESRTRFDGGQLQATLYYTKLEVRLGHALATALDGFVAEFSKTLAPAA